VPRGAVSTDIAVSGCVEATRTFVVAVIADVVCGAAGVERGAASDEAGKASTSPTLDVVSDGSPAVAGAFAALTTVEIAVTPFPADGHIAHTTTTVSRPPSVVVAATRPRPMVSGGSVRVHCAWPISEGWRHARSWEGTGATGYCSSLLLSFHSTNGEE